ncbi:MAG TPA: cytochrome c3 family protein, partial [bacterium]|nr:cytochrome c3 family protein [bacterium]
MTAPNCPRRTRRPILSGWLPLTVLLSSALVLPASAELPAGDACAECHLELDDEAVDVSLFFIADAHGRAGLSCADCHGGDRTMEDEDEAMSEDAGFVGAPGRLEIPDFCGRCHSDPDYMRGFDPNLPVDQLTLYRTSLHGQKNLEGDANVATCVDCHRAHDIRPPSEPRSSVHPQQIPTTCGRCHTDADLMKEYGIPTDQVAEYEKSVHGQSLLSGRDLSAPACNDCHGDHGALPPQVGSIFAVCGHCHVHNRELYSASAKRVAFEDLGEPGCVTCHGNHGIEHPTEEMLSLDDSALCSDCHSDDGSHASDAILGMRASLDTLRTALTEAEALLDRAEQKGMYVTNIRFELQDTRQALFRARTEVHRFDADTLAAMCAVGLATADTVKADSHAALEEFRFRRNGLAAASLIISIFALSLWR